MSAGVAGGQSARSGAIVVAGRGAQLVLQLGLTLVLARMLTPDDFGVVAYIFPLALLVQNVANSGLQSAIIQHKDLTETEASALFWASLRWNAWVAGAMVLASGALAVLYRDARAAPVGAVWALVILGATLSAVPEALLKRQFRFGAVLGAQLAAQVASVAVALYAASAGAGYWTFVLQMAVVELGRVVLVWTFCSWRPSSPQSLGPAQHAALVELRTYWRGFASSRLVGWIGEQSDRITVGVMGGSTTLGLYDFAKRWGTFAFLELYTPLTEVAIASLSGVRDDPRRLAAYTRNAFLPVLAASMPVMGFLFAEPVGVLTVLFAPKWAGAAPMLQAIALAIAIGSIGRLALWVSLATGGTSRQLRWMLISTPVFVVCVLVGAHYGAFGVALGVAVANALTSLPAVWYLLAPTTVRVRDVLPAWAAPLVAAAAGVLAIRTLGGSLPPPTTFGGLMARGFTFLGVYLLAWVVIPGGRAMLLAARPRGPVVES